LLPKGPMVKRGGKTYTLGKKIKKVKGSQNNWSGAVRGQLSERSPYVRRRRVEKEGGKNQGKTAKVQPNTKSRNAGKGASKKDPRVAGAFSSLRWYPGKVVWGHRVKHLRRKTQHNVVKTGRVKCTRRVGKQKKEGGKVRSVASTCRPRAQWARGKGYGFNAG